MRTAVLAAVLALPLLAPLQALAAGEEHTMCKSACAALKKTCPETCKESGTKQEQAACLGECPNEVKDCEKNCPAMEARARKKKLGEPAGDVVRLPSEGDDAPAQQQGGDGESGD